MLPEKYLLPFRPPNLSWNGRHWKLQKSYLRVYKLMYYDAINARKSWFEVFEEDRRVILSNHIHWNHFYGRSKLGVFGYGGLWRKINVSRHVSSHYTSAYIHENFSRKSWKLMKITKIHVNCENSQKFHENYRK